MDDDGDVDADRNHRAKRGPAEVIVNDVVTCKRVEEEHYEKNLQHDIESLEKQVALDDKLTAT